MKFKKNKQIVNQIIGQSQVKDEDTLSLVIPIEFKKDKDLFIKYRVAAKGEVHVRFAEEVKSNDDDEVKFDYTNNEYLSFPKMCRTYNDTKFSEDIYYAKVYRSCWLSIQQTTIGDDFKSWCKPLAEDCQLAIQKFDEGQDKSDVEYFRKLKNNQGNFDFMNKKQITCFQYATQMVNLDKISYDDQAIDKVFDDITYYRNERNKVSWIEYFLRDCIKTLNKDQLNINQFFSTKLAAVNLYEADKAKAALEEEQNADQDSDSLIGENGKDGVPDNDEDKNENAIGEKIDDDSLKICDDNEESDQNSKRLAKKHKKSDSMKAKIEKLKNRLAKYEQIEKEEEELEKEDQDDDDSFEVEDQPPFSTP